MHAAVWVDEGNVAIVQGSIRSVAGVHSQNQISGGIECAALREVKAAEDLYVVGHFHPIAGFIGRPQWLSSGEVLGVDLDRAENCGNRDRSDQSDFR